MHLTSGMLLVCSVILVDSPVVEVSVDSFDA